MVEMASIEQCKPVFLSDSRLIHCDHVTAEAGLPRSGREWEGSSEMFAECLDARQQEHCPWSYSIIYHTS